MKTAISMIAYSVLLPAFILSAGATNVAACECVQWEGPIAELVAKGKGESDAVFVGTAAHLLKDQKGNLYAVEFEVLGVWKGQVSKRMRIATGSGGGDCGYPFQAGETYLVYARNSTEYTSVKTLTAGICSRTATLSEAKADLPHLGRRRRPTVNLHDEN